MTEEETPRGSVLEHKTAQAKEDIRQVRLKVKALLAEIQTLETVEAELLEYLAKLDPSASELVEVV